MGWSCFIKRFFTYCLTVWHNGNSTSIDKLFKLRKRGARITTGFNNDIRNTDVLKTLKWDPLNKIIDQRYQILTFKVLQGLTPAHM